MNTRMSISHMIQVRLTQGRVRTWPGDLRALTNSESQVIFSLKSCYINVFMFSYLTMSSFGTPCVHTQKGIGKENSHIVHKFDRNEDTGNKQSMDIGRVDRQKRLFLREPIQINISHHEA